ncbi:hypothetical protein [Allosalinactinospora lopnorensis]|nr:hypothetical protein [Allosalinactinospora lopnorensis]
MGKHGKDDTPKDSGSGGSADTDGSESNKHGSESFPEQGSDGQEKT